MRILYVEEDPLDVELTTREFTDSAPQHALEWVSSLAEARELLARFPKNHYDLVAVDQGLPGGGGAALLRVIRAKGLPIAVVITARQGGAEMAAAFLKAGADGFIVKQAGYLPLLVRQIENAYELFTLGSRTPSHPLRVLFACGHTGAFEDAQRHLARFAPNIEPEVARSGAEILERLTSSPAGEPWDVLVMEDNLPDSSPADILRDLRLAQGLSLPVVVAAARPKEEEVGRILSFPAVDLLVKDAAYLERLPAAVENAFAQATLLAEREARLESDARFKRLADNIPGLIFQLASNPPRFLYASPAASAMTGYSAAEFCSGETFIGRLVHPGDRARFLGVLAEGADLSAPLTLRLISKSGKDVWVELQLGRDGGATGEERVVEGIAWDVTSRREAAADAQSQMQHIASLSSIDQAISNSADLNVALIILIDKVISELKVDAASILLYDPISQKLETRASAGFRTRLAVEERVQIGEAFAGLAMYERRTIHYPDVHLPEPSRATARLIKEESFAAAVYSPLITKGEVKGVLQVYHHAPLSPQPGWWGFLEVLSSQAAIAIDHAVLFERLNNTIQELTLEYDSILEAWARAADMHERWNKGHNLRCSMLSIELAEALEVAPTDLASIRQGALLHDIGKLALPDGILQKPGPLNEDEWREVRQHPRYANELLSPVPYLARAIDIPYCHHERWDGNGYPRGLRGELIPYSARIFAVIDVWDAMTHDQIYRPALPREEARAFIHAQSGKMFDPVVVAAFMKMRL